MKRKDGIPEGDPMAVDVAEYRNAHGKYLLTIC
jgi:hypothetical protein